MIWHNILRPKAEKARICERIMNHSTLHVEFDEKKIDAVMAQMDQCHLPGAAVGIAIDGKPVYRKGFGVASMELPVALSPSIRMPIGSTTKHFTCLAYLLQCERGKVGLDDPIGKYLPELHPVVHALTVRQLMGHTSGLRDAYGMTLLFNGLRHETSAADIIARYRVIDDLNAPPGTLWSYNNGGYQLLSAIIERVTDRLLDDMLREDILVPVGMNDTFLRRFDSKCVPNCVSLHLGNEKTGFEKGRRPVEGFGQGGIYSTIDDMLLWLSHMDAPVVGSADTWKAMKTSLTLDNGQQTGYGLGLKMGWYRGIETLEHAGGVFGGNSQMIKLPGVGLDIAIMVNRSDVSAGALAYSIIEACVPNLEPIPEWPPRPIATGVFRSADTEHVIELLGRENQQILAADGTELPVACDAEGAYRELPLGLSVKESWQLIGDPARPAAIEYHFYGKTYELQRLPSVKNADPGALAGRYHATAGIGATVKGDRIQFTGGSGSIDYVLEALAPGIWRAAALGPMPFVGVLTFDQDNRSFGFSSNGTFGLKFCRI